MREVLATSTHRDQISLANLGDDLREFAILASRAHYKHLYTRLNTRDSIRLFIRCAGADFLLLDIVWRRGKTQGLALHGLFVSQM